MGTILFVIILNAIPLVYLLAKLARNPPLSKPAMAALAIGCAGGGLTLLACVMQSDPLVLSGLGISYGTALLVFLYLKAQSDPAAAAAAGNVLRGSRVEAGSKSRKGQAGAIEIAGVEIPRQLEAQHFLFTGTTGTGKTQAINSMLRTIRSRGQRAVIADPGGGFYSRFGRPGDVLFNPFDGRTVDWSPFADIENDYDCERIAKAIVPDGVGDGMQWHHYSQSLVAAVLRSMHAKGERSIKRLLYWLTTAEPKELADMLAGTPAAALCAKGNERMLASTRAILSSYVGVFPYLADEGTFSVREWTRNAMGEGWLFVTYRDDQMGMLRGLVATMLELAIVEGLSLSEDQDRGLWFVMDEVDSLGKVTSLRAGLTKLRKYGGRCILGLQTVAQLRTTYGRDEAQTLLANCSTKLVLRAGDAETARTMEDELGQQEIERTTRSDSTSKGEFFKGSISASQQYTRQSAVMASEIMGLLDLHGFLKMPGETIHRVALDYVGMPEVQPTFQRPQQVA
ncbi:type IV secretion system DNA-binding domain-containing protein [Xanthomonas citri]|uniref:type IV secretion system DNA-binding domain-containing protein n=1 Tax=Xanthomonas citri TaxID=346 RepID=UPI0005B3C989|nr:type IV secretion system DNA-binding domain-containing protein [Xanthomonas citri]TBX01105.1 TrwB [Xanthomonas citri pv. aurantifolii]